MDNMSRNVRGIKGEELIRLADINFDDEDFERAHYLSLSSRYQDYLELHEKAKEIFDIQTRNDKVAVTKDSDGEAVL